MKTIFMPSFPASSLVILLAPIPFMIFKVVSGSLIKTTSPIPFIRQRIWLSANGFMNYTGEQKDLPYCHAAVSPCWLATVNVFLHTGHSPSNNCTFCPISLETLPLFSFDVPSGMESIFCLETQKSS